MGFEVLRSRLRDHVDLLTGFAFKSSGFIESGNGTPLLRGDNVGQGALRWDNLKKWPSNELKRLEKYQLKTGDVVLAMDRPWIAAGLKYARLRDSDVPSLLVQRVARLRGKNGLLQSYLALLIGSPAFTEHVLSVQTGTTIPHISGNQIGAFEFDLPPATEQARAALLIGAIEDRIDLLRQTNTTLEAIAQALFKSWFVDFDPVHAKAEGRAPEAMDAATAALFPSEFEESELGPIPRGWRLGTLDDLSELNAASWSSKRHPDTVTYVDLSGVHENRIGKINEQPFSDAPSRARRSLRDGDTIVGTVRPGNRAFAHIHRPTANLTGSTGFAVLSPKDEVSAPFVYLAATRSDSIERLANLADGGAYPAVRPGVVSATPVVIPPASVIAAFARITAPMLHKIGESRSAEATLVELRDTLLPRLLSGKLRLPEPWRSAREPENDLCQIHCQ